MSSALADVAPGHTGQRTANNSPPRRARRRRPPPRAPEPATPRPWPDRSQPQARNGQQQPTAGPTATAATTPGAGAGNPRPRWRMSLPATQANADRPTPTRRAGRSPPPRAPEAGNTTSALADVASGHTGQRGPANAYPPRPAPSPPPRAPQAGHRVRVGADRSQPHRPTRMAEQLPDGCPTAATTPGAGSRHAGSALAHISPSHTGQRGVSGMKEV